MFFDRINLPEIATTLYGTTTHHPAIIGSLSAFAGAIEHVRTTLDNDTFDRCVATGAAMDTAEAVRYARLQIKVARSELAEQS